MLMQRYKDRVSALDSIVEANTFIGTNTDRQ